MAEATYFDKYDAHGAYHWIECDRRLSNWRRYNPALVARYEVTAQAIASLGARQAMLDIGCGDGMLMARAAPFIGKVVGVDSEASAIRWAKEKLRDLPNCEPIHTVCYDLPFDRATFDLVTSADVIEHLQDPTQHLQEICRVLRPDGALVLTTPQWRPDRKWDVRHEKEYRPEELRTLLVTYFDEVTMTYFWPKKWSALYATRIGWHLLKLLAIAGGNPFAASGAHPAKYGQSLAVCRRAKPQPCSPS